MNNKGRIGWIIGVAIASALCLFLLILFVAALSEVDGGSDGPSMSVDEMGAHCYRASELFCAGVYYTDKALSADPNEISYDEWTMYADKAQEYWDALDYELALIEGYADTEGFQKAFEDTQVKASFAQNISNALFPTAYAIDTDEIMRVYNGAEAGKELQAVADHLGRDKDYAESALKVAKGQIDAQKWSNVDDAMYVLETAARVAKNVAQATAVVASAPYATGALATSVLVVNGASCMWQFADDACYVFMGDDYYDSEFVVNLGKVTDFVAPAAFVGNMLTMNFTGKEMETVLASYTFADTLRSALLDDKFAGIQLKQLNGSVVSMTPDEVKAYQQALKDGQSLPGEIEALIKALEGKPDEIEPVDLPEYKVTADKSTAMVEEWIAFSVQGTKPEYTYVWEYGGNKNPQDTATFNYMYQTAGTYTMYVTILDADGKAIGRGACSVEVVEAPTPTPNSTPTENFGSGDFAELAGHYNEFYNETLWPGPYPIGTLSEYTLTTKEYIITADGHFKGYFYDRAPDQYDIVYFDLVKENGRYYGYNIVWFSDDYSNHKDSEPNYEFVKHGDYVYIVNRKSESGDAFMALIPFERREWLYGGAEGFDSIEGLDTD